MRCCLVRTSPGDDDTVTMTTVTMLLSGHLLCKCIGVRLLGRRLLGVSCAALASHCCLAGGFTGTLGRVSSL